MGMMDAKAQGSTPSRYPGIIMNGPQIQKLDCAEIRYGRMSGAQGLKAADFDAGDE